MNVMKALLVAVLLLAEASFAEENSRFVVLSVPKDQGAGLAKMLSGSKGKSDLDTAVPKTKAQVLGDWTVTDAWGDEKTAYGKRQEFSKPVGEITVDGELVEKLGPTLTIEGGMTNKGVLEHIRAEVNLALGKKEWRKFEILAAETIIKQDTWDLLCRWSDDTQDIMLWRYEWGSTRVPPTEGAKSDVFQTYRADMVWLQADAADIEKAGKAGLENRAKALEWISGRAKSKRDGRLAAKNGQKTIWGGSVQRLQGSDNEFKYSEYLYVEGTIRPAEDKIQVDWGIRANEDPKTIIPILSGVEVSNDVWHFQPVTGVPGFNFLAVKVIAE